jgi:hypothetical protein
VRKELDRKKKEGSKVEKPKESVKLSPKNFETEEIELEPGKDDEGWKSMLKSLGTPDPGAEEEDSISKMMGFDQFERSGTPMMVPGFGGAARGIKQMADKGLGKSAASGIGETVGTKVPPVPSASRMLQDKMRLAGEKAAEGIKESPGITGRRMEIAAPKNKLKSALKPLKGGAAKLSPSQEAQIRERARSLFEQLKSGKISQSEFAKQLRLLENIVK